MLITFIILFVVGINRISVHMVDLLKLRSRNSIWRPSDNTILWILMAYEYDMNHAEVRLEQTDVVKLKLGSKYTYFNFISHKTALA